MVNLIKDIINLFNSDFLIIHNQTIRNLSGFALVLWGYVDAVKYRNQTKKIKQVKTAKGNSRNFINKAIGNDLFRLFYFFFIDRNLYILITSLLALICMVELFFVIYRFYPYRMRGCPNFKRPNLWDYFVNSIISNQIRKRL
jgi:hypothetical protein